MKNEHCYSKYNFIVIRSLPGAGKTTYAKTLASKLEGETQIFETDDFFCLNTGKYQFDATKLGAAHRWNFQRFCRAVDKKVQNIILSNTNVRASEFKQYLIYAKENGYNCQIKEPPTSWKYDVNECFKRNTHGVPLSTIQKMYDRYEHNLTVEKILSGK